jgi:NAD(P)-dependent dehydrogenase (short-subunit alcohol dehydrogenase family)
MAFALAEAGADVVITSRKLEHAEPVAKEIAEATGRRVMPLVMDVTNPEDVRRMQSETRDALGGLDILVNNAGVNIRHLAHEYTLEEWNTLLATNVTGVFLCCQAVLPGMMAQKSGRIINIGSMMGVVGMPLRVPYSATKGAVHQMSRTLALEVAKYGITVNTIAPGPFLTEMNRQVIDQPEVYNFFIERIPLGRWADPEELRGVVVFLASEASSYITGSTMLVDGGWTAQ